METKVCTKCGEEKPATTEYFVVARLGLFGVSSQCKRCKKAYYEKNKEEIALRNKQYREKNKEAIALGNKQYYEKNKEKIALKSKQYREKNKEKRALTRKQYYEKNKEKVVLKSKQYREKNKEKIVLKSKQYREKNKEKIALSQKQHYEKNKEAIARRRKQYYEKNKEKFALKSKQYRENLPAGVYKITNKKTNAIYIGASTVLSVRWRRHLRDLRKEQHSNINLQEDYNKYGLEAFEFEVLEKHPPETQFEALEKIEQKTINHFLAEGKKLYNRTLG